MAESLHISLGTSACLQWLCHSGEQTVARGPLVTQSVWGQNFLRLVALNHWLVLRLQMNI